ncbi:MAG TPA: ankyrin repeat domain-containing protein [Burkholderiales bacterium]|nr:ankyrin repeat domain-containing protein [Burkholderiales bacterium]
MNTLLAAIVDDDLTRVTELLAGNAALARRLVDEERLYERGIYHWIYVGDTALHLAAAGYRVKIVQLLIAAGADPNSVRNRRRSSPLHYAADGFLTGSAWDPGRQVTTLQTLLDAGADLHAQDQNGATALHRAVRTRCAAAAIHLLSAGSDPSRRNKAGSTPFHLAVQNTGRGGSGEEIAREAQRQIVDGFISFGVSPHLKDGKGRSVMDCAQSVWLRNLLVRNAD